MGINTRKSTNGSTAEQIFHIDQFGGIDKSSTATQIAVNRSPDMLNVMLDERNALTKRPGYIEGIHGSLGSGKINGLNFLGTKVIIVCGTDFFIVDSFEMI